MKTIFKAFLAATTLIFATATFAQDGHHDPFASHLSYKNNTLHIHATFPVAPVVGEESFLVLEARDAQTHQVTEVTDQVKVALWMPSMGHGSSPTRVERAVDADGNVVPGTFTVRNVFFIMAGEWEVRVTLTNASGNKETKSFEVTLGSGSDNGGHGGHHH